MLLMSLLIPVFNAKASAANYSLKIKPVKYWLCPYGLPKLSYNASSQAYEFNPNPKEQLPGNSDTSVAVGGITYGASLPAYLNSRNGLKLTDQINKLTIGMTPQFATQTGKIVNSHIVYPLVNSNAQLVYTPKGNGLKEDIILYSSPGIAAQFSYKLQLPEGLSAKQQA